MKICTLLLGSVCTTDSVFSQVFFKRKLPDFNFRYYTVPSKFEVETKDCDGKNKTVHIRGITPFNYQFQTKFINGKITSCN